MKHESCDRDKFHVVTMISNPARFSRRYELYLKFSQHMKEAGVHFHTVEVQLGDRPFVVTDKHNPYHVQLRHWDELWIKEQAINVGIERLATHFPDWETVAWIDADIEFTRRDWVDETLNQLQVYQIVQMWESAVDLGPDGQTIAVHESFMSKYLKKCATHPEGPYSFAHPGYAWAARREALDGMGMLYSRAILGAADRHMALAFIGKVEDSFATGIHSAYMRDLKRFQKRVHHAIRRDVGCVNGTILHNWHGRKANRKYHDRWQILVNNHYQPHHDIKRSHNGIYAFHDDGSFRFMRLRDEIRNYFRARSENSIDL